MKTKVTAIASIVLLLLYACFVRVHAQQITPVSLLAEPQKYKGIVMGIGSGDFNKIKVASSVVSAQGAGELLIGTHRTKKKGNWISFPVVGRYNFLNSSKIFRLDTFNLRNIVFLDNNQLANAGGRIRTIKPFFDDQFLLSFVVDYSLGSFSVVDSSERKSRFLTHSAMIGTQLGFLLSTNMGPIGITVSPSINYLNVQNLNANAFQIAAKSPNQIGNQFIGFGGRGLLQLNDFPLFGDLRGFVPIGSKATVPGLTNRVSFTFGGNAVGMIAKLTKGDKSGMN